MLQGLNCLACQLKGCTNSVQVTDTGPSPSPIRENKVKDSPPVIDTASAYIGDVQVLCLRTSSQVHLTVSCRGPSWKSLPLQMFTVVFDSVQQTFSNCLKMYLFRSVRCPFVHLPDPKMSSVSLLIHKYRHTYIYMLCFADERI